MVLAKVVPNDITNLDAREKLLLCLWLAQIQVWRWDPPEGEKYIEVCWREWVEVHKVS